MGSGVLPGGFTRRLSADGMRGGATLMRRIGDTTDNVEGARSTLFQDKTALPAIPQIGSFNSRRAARCEPNSSLKSASPQLPRLLKFGGVLCWYQVICSNSSDQSN